MLFHNDYRHFEKLNRSFLQKYFRILKKKPFTPELFKRSYFQNLSMNITYRVESCDGFCSTPACPPSANASR